ncbi:MAG: hypothetical protein WBX38_08070 [Candidatus Sulfotelmatobacter sp.]
MINPVSGSQASLATEAVKPAAPNPQQTQQAPRQSNPQPSDTVTLKSTGNADQNGDSK